MSEAEAALALARFGLGARPDDIERIADDPRAAVLAELEQPHVAGLDGGGLPEGAEVYLAIRREQMERRAARDRRKDKTGADDRQPSAEGGSAGKPSPAPMAMLDRIPPVSADYFHFELATRQARILSAEIGYVERLVAFWANHFALQSDKDEQIRGLAGAFEREAIRPFVLGRFSDMLLAATRHPAMLLSLDNVESMGPNSPAGLKSHKGLNENHAREILELHTVGVDGGYNQGDVTEFARILTGWTFVRNVGQAGVGTFTFRPAWHEPGDRTLMGRSYPADAKRPRLNEGQGTAALADLAAHPATARHIAVKLARHFVSDDPPPALVERLATTFQETGGDLKAVSCALIEAPEAWDGGRKFATPQQFVAAALRASGVTLEPPRLVAMLRALGEVPWAPTSPAGFHDDAATWLSPDGMTTRLDVAERIAQRASLDMSPDQIARQLLGPRLSAETRQAVSRAESGHQAVALLLMSPEFQWR